VRKLKIFIILISQLIILLLSLRIRFKKEEIHFFPSFEKKKNSERLLFFLIGTRPEMIKIAPILIELKKQNKFSTLICLSGQHQNEMLNPIISLFNIEIDCHLNIEKFETNSEFLSFGLQRMNQLFEIIQPKFIFIQGDTSSELFLVLIFS
jgi:UDP-N-acetylglucosamine 2-epimerase